MVRPPRNLDLFADPAPHPHLGDHTDSSRGNGLLLWFTSDDFDAIARRAAERGVEVLDGPLFNENARQHEIWMRGPEGYTVVVAGVRVPSD